MVKLKPARGRSEAGSPKFEMNSQSISNFKSEISNCQQIPLRQYSKIF